MVQGRGPYLALVAAVDDATGAVPYALFREQEDAQGYFLLLREMIQAKGRIERLFGTLQDRLVSELRLAGACTLEEANRVLEEYLPRYNALFGVPAAQRGLAYREVPSEVDIDGVLCFKYQRSVAHDNTVRFFGHTLQLLPDTERRSYARARVEVQERLDGSLVVCYQGKTIATQEVPPHPVTLRARKGLRSVSTTPGENTPW